MAPKLSVLILLCLTNASVRTEIQSVVIDKSSGQLVIVDGFHEDFVAWANFTDVIKTTGWSFLEVTTNNQYNDSIQAYAAGAVEAAVTSPLIYKHWMNTLMDYCGPFKAQSDYCERLKYYINTNLEWVQDQIKKQPNSPYWIQVHLALLQLKGLEDSYNDELSFPLGPMSFNPLGFLLFQMGGDLEDLEAALNKSSETRPLGSGSCSALIKLLPDNKDLLISHDTWNTYQSMLRIIKKYIFPFKASPLGDEQIPGKSQAFSSYPGSIFSGDDFYILSSGLVTLETTIGNSNPALWDFVQPTGTVMEWLRNIVANRLASTGKEWADIFSQYNSGTYNNQWMIVDYKHFKPGKMETEQELFVVLEQIPGMVWYEDKTQELKENGYWSSYNIPYYTKIFNASGCNELVDKFGPWFSFDKNPRAQIFRRNQTAVKDIESMVRLMRYNNFKEDPLSNRQHGGTDMKLTSYQMYRNYGMIAVSGPTFDQLPPFQWSTSPYKDLLHMGEKCVWNTDLCGTRTRPTKRHVTSSVFRHCRNVKIALSSVRSADRSSLSETKPQRPQTRAHRPQTRAQDHRPNLKDHRPNLTDQTSQTTDQSPRLQDQTSNTTDQTSQTTDQTSKTTDQSSQTTDQTSQTTDQTSKTTDQTSQTTDQSSRPQTKPHRPNLKDHRPNLTDQTSQTTDQSSRPQTKLTDHRPNLKDHRPELTDHRPNLTNHRPELKTTNQSSLTRAQDHRPELIDHGQNFTDHRPNIINHRPNLKTTDQTSQTTDQTSKTTDQTSQTTDQSSKTTDQSSRHRPELTDHGPELTD
ncbi:hypothetical protein WMY93_004975 [Mugilogobius chulae]|uniref:Phospholipase B-like n=1 Tax=Mugilogobius chulae TaxID=88201 RepID=A0AAW0PSL4_9GOBI